MPKEQNFRELYADTLVQMDDLTDRQKRVLQAALELFAAQGFEATSTQQIADKAGVSVGSVYHHFPNKQALLIATLSPIFKGTMETMVSQFTENTFGKGFETLEELVDSVVNDRMLYIQENILVVKLMFTQLLTNPDMVTQFKEFFGTQASVVLYPAIEKLRAKGEIIDVPTEDIIQLMFSLVVGYIGKLVLDIHNKSLAEEIEMAKRIIIKALKP